jgi:fatty-acyl-CoA synthase
MPDLPNPVAVAGQTLKLVDKGVRSLRVLAGAGLMGPYRPDQVVGMGLAVRRYGVSLAAAYAMQAAIHPDRPCVIDERGQLTFAQMEARTTTIAAGLADLGLGPHDRVGLLCRNHRGFLDGSGAAAKVGADVLFLNTGFAGPQLADVLRREGASAVILDEEFLGLTKSLPSNIHRIVAWEEGAVGLPTLEGMLAGGPRPLPGRPARESQQIILTSGTTGTPKGAQRSRPGASAMLDPLVALLENIPLRSGDIIVDAAPMFHSWGLAYMGFGLMLGGTLVIRRRFDPETTLAMVAQHKATVLAAVPVMLQRIMDLPEPVRRRYDTSSLRVVAVSGSALPGELATRFMDAFGDVLYNLYGSTEVAWASIAGPEDLRAAPGTAGRPPFGTVVKLLDRDGNEVPPGQPGRIFVANSLLFSGYTGGGSKATLDGLMSTGDTGHFDADGRLFVDGRDDDMIVSGGENVFPREVEDLLADHPAVVAAGVIGVADPEYGQRLKAFVVLRDGERVDADAIRAYVRSRLARYKVPRDVEFLNELPRNATGKVLKNDLRGV